MLCPIPIGALCHEPTYAVQQICSLLDHLVGTQKERFGDGQPQRLRRLEIDDEIKFGRLLDRDIAGFRPAQNLVDHPGGAPEQVR